MLNTEQACCPNHDGRQFASIDDFCDAHPQFREKWIAEQCGIAPARFSKLKSRKYGLRPAEGEVPAIAALLKQSESYVRELYAAKVA